MVKNSIFNNIQFDSDSEKIPLKTSERMKTSS